MKLRELLYGLYSRRLARALPVERLPQHVGVIMDGNRRWARTLGTSTREGHRRGAAKVHEFLRWCDEAGIKMVTLWMLSTDNLSRNEAELRELVDIVVSTVESIASDGYRINIVGAPDVLPSEAAERLERVENASPHRRSVVVNVAVGYGGRREIVDAVRSLLRAHLEKGTPLEQLAASITDADISDHLYTKGFPDPDLVIRTSGEQRLSGFLMWQSAHSEFYFCEAYWPGFRKVDFQRALRDYAERERRFGA